MPLRFQVDHVQRTVVGVAEGDVTLQDVIEFTLEIERNGAAGYHKIVDVMGGTSRLSIEDFVAYRERMRGRPRAHGPLALVTSDRNGPLARLFAQFTAKERPAQVFASIHEARKWLREQPIAGRAQAQ
ncbi:MAG TPA: hypothetical protein VFB13_07880 [Reyranella sp.]|jgi:hypothetical protein|nr:hypothetical protein [Reyranella sp.]